MAGKEMTPGTGDIKIYGRLVNATKNPSIVHAQQVEATGVTIGGTEYTNQDDINKNLLAAINSGGTGSLPDGFLDSNGKVSSSYLPSYVDDVVEASEVDIEANTVTVDNIEQTPATGKLYVDNDGNVYRYTGSKLVQVSSADTVSLASRVTTLENTAETYAYDASDTDGLFLTQTINGNDRVLIQYNSDDFDPNANLATGQTALVSSGGYTLGIKAIDTNKITDPDTHSDSLFA